MRSSQGLSSINAMHTATPDHQRSALRPNHNNVAIGLWSHFKPKLFSRLSVDVCVEGVAVATGSSLHDESHACVMLERRPAVLKSGRRSRWTRLVGRSKSIEHRYAIRDEV